MLINRPVGIPSGFAIGGGSTGNTGINAAKKLAGQIESLAYNKNTPQHIETTTPLSRRNDGFISRRELSAARSSIINPSSQGYPILIEIALLRAQFKEYDKDGDRRLSHKEIKNAFFS